MDIRLGLPQWLKPLLTLPAAIPLMVISAGETTMGIPFIGAVNFGPLYPLVLIPIGVVGASNAVNLLGGFNGSEAGMGIVYMLALGIYGFLNGSVGSVIFLISAASLLGFIKYNWFPAKILPGDSLTYLLGSLVAAGAIVGNMEKAALIALTPFIIEFFFRDSEDSLLGLVFLGDPGNEMFDRDGNHYVAHAALLLNALIIRRGITLHSNIILAKNGG